MFEYYNCNPLSREVNDCCVRAISLAENKSWDECYEELSRYAQEQCILLDDAMFIEPYLNGKYPTICYKCKGSRMTVGEFTESHPQGVFLATMKGHITCIINGVIRDIWDCSDKRIWHVWKVK